MSSPFKHTLSQRIALWAYTLLLALLVPVLAIYNVVKVLAKADGYDKKRLERFGVLKSDTQQSDLWIHCVSVGEVVAASPLIEKLLEQDNLRITITTTTYTGYQRVIQSFDQRVQHSYLPYDFPLFMALLLNRLKPSAILITEVELWPNLVHQAWLKNIPTLVINARMTNKSCKSYSKLSALFSPMLQKLEHACAQGQRDFDNYLKLGIPPQKLTLTNNMKFDLQSHADSTIKDELITEYQLEGKRVFLAGSTHDPEENVILDAYESLLAKYPDLALLIVPRHPQRFDSVYQLCEKRRLTLCRASENITADANVILVDKMGVLSKLYQVADFAFIGGSIAQRGGHNALEAAAYAVPAIMGSSRHNNPEICEALKESGGLKTTDTAKEMEHVILEWLSNPEQATDLGQNGRKVIETNSGAVQKTLELINATIQ